eukprot:gene10855-10962_t
MSVSRKLVPVGLHLHLARQGVRAMSSSAAPEVVSANRSFGGTVTRYRHYSEAVKCEMGFAVYTPKAAEAPDAAVPALYWLSGLTCDDTNFIFKAG